MNVVSALAIAFALAGCAFDSAGYGGADLDAEIDADPLAADARVADAIDAAGPGDATAADAAPPPFACPASYTPLGDDGHAYRYVDTARRWEQAERRCRDDGAHLLVFDAPTLVANLAERDLVLTILPRSRYTSAWVGISDRVVEGTFRAVTGAEIDPAALSWASGEPNSLLGNEDCLAMSLNVPDAPALSGRMSDARCGYVAPYICECDGVPEDASSF